MIHGRHCRCQMPDNLHDWRRVRRADTFVERELALWIERHGHEIDPYQVGSLMSEFNTRFLSYDVSGAFVLDEGALKGLRTLHRSGECFRANNWDVRMRYNVELGAGPLEFECFCAVRVFTFKPPAFILHVEVDYIEAHIDFCYNFDFGLESILHKVVLKDAKGLRMWISGTGFFGAFCFILYPIIRLATRYYKRSILNWMQDEVEEEINDGFYRFQFPCSFIQPVIIN